MDIEKMCAAVCDLSHEVGQFILGEAGHFNRESVEIKSFNQLVSYVDKNAEKMLVEGLQEILPEAGFITEEATVTSAEKEYMWVIDPLDGTTNFVHGIPVYCISIGLLHQSGGKRKTMMGVVYEMNRDEMFYAWEGSKAYMNGKEIRVKQNAELKKSLLATGFPYYDFEIMQSYLETLRVLMTGSEGMRRMGSAAADLAYVACGRFDGFFEYGLSPWDVAGGAFIVQQAGGTITDFSGGDDYIFGREIVAASSALHSSLLGIVKEKFKKG